MPHRTPWQLATTLLVAGAALVVGPLAGSASAAQTVVFEDTFDDGNLQGWSTYGAWGVQCSGTSCVATDTPYRGYWNHMSAGMSRSIALPAGATDCAVTFDTWQQTEWYYDYFRASVSSDLGWSTPVYRSGSHGVTPVSVKVAGTVHLSFAFSTDYSVTYDGVFVDNVKITCGAVGPVDSDGDGVADEDDAFPTDPTETVDTDGDGAGDNADVLPNDPNIGIVPLTAAGVCAVVEGFSSNVEVADGLCDKLVASEQAHLRGNTRASSNTLKAFDNQLTAQTGKAISVDEAASLRSLVALLW